MVKLLLLLLLLMTTCYYDVVWHVLMLTPVVLYCLVVNGTVCGNQRCELTEACSQMDASVVQANGASSSTCCLTDCPVVVQSCPADGVSGIVCSGHGSCLTGAGVCHCFDGYGGDACGVCTSQYTAVTDTTGRVVRCVLLAGSYSTCFNGVRDGLEQGVDCGGVCPACAGTASLSQSAGTTVSSPTVALAVSVTVAVAVGGAAVVALVVLRRRRSGPAALSGGKGRGASGVVGCQCGRGAFPAARDDSDVYPSMGSRQGRVRVASRVTPNGVASGRLVNVLPATTRSVASTTPSLEMDLTT